MEKTGEPHPKIHNLGRLASLLRRTWRADENDLFDILSAFAVAARYDDPRWAEALATPAQTGHLLRRTEQFLSHFLLA